MRWMLKMVSCDILASNATKSSSKRIFDARP
jgi:hypothetical protein